MAVLILGHGVVNPHYFIRQRKCQCLPDQEGGAGGARVHWRSLMIGFNAFITGCNE
jgi:hypothetical protein